MSMKIQKIVLFEKVNKMFPTSIIVYPIKYEK